VGGERWKKNNENEALSPATAMPKLMAFYSKKLDETEQAEHLLAVKVEGLDYEIALMRVKLQITHCP